MIHNLFWVWSVNDHASALFLLPNLFHTKTYISVGIGLFFLELLACILSAIHICYLLFMLLLKHVMDMFSLCDEQITSIQAVASISSWCAQFKSDVKLSSVWNFLWKFFWKTVSSPTCDSEVRNNLTGPYVLNFL
jgi:hypothetical protein